MKLSPERAFGADGAVVYVFHTAPGPRMNATFDFSQSGKRGRPAGERGARKSDLIAGLIIRTGELTCEKRPPRLRA